MIKWLSGLLDRIFVVLGAFIFSQAPHFFQHYSQRLGGHVAELQRQIAAMQQAAERSGKSLQSYVQKFLSQSDVDLVSQGEIMQEIIVRHFDLSEAYTALVNASAFSRSFAFLRHFQLDIAKMTLRDFKLGLTFSMEGLIYALVGIGFGYLIYWTLSQISTKVWRLVTNLANSV